MFNGGCDQNARCSSTGATRTCTCNTGFTGNGLSCADLNECLTANGGCDANATCTNTVGSRICACRAGFTGTGQVCSDVNECLTSNGGCDANATCTNTLGSRTCVCRTGFTGNGFTCTPNTPHWTVETVATNAGSTSSIGVDSTGPAIAYTSSSPGGVYFRRRSGFWSAAETVDSSANAVEPAMTLSGSTWVVANSQTNVSGSSVTHQVVSWRRSAGWSFESSLATWERPSLAVGGGREHLTALGRNSTGAVIYSSRNSGTPYWSTPVTLATGASGFAPRIASTPGGSLAVLYAMNPSGLVLLRSAGAGAGWTATTLTTSQVYDFALAVDPGGLTAFVTYYQASPHRIVYEEWSLTSSQRVTQRVVDVPGGTGAGTMWFSGLSIAEDALGVIHIAWLDFTRGSSLRYANNNHASAPGTFIAETVAPAGSVLGSTSIAVDSTYGVHISFPAPGSTFGNLGYAVLR